MDEQTARWNSPPMMPLPPSNVVACGSPLRFPEQIRLLPLLPQPPSLRIWGTALLAPGCRVGVRYRLRLRIQARRASGSRLAAPASASGSRLAAPASASSGVLPGRPLAAGEGAERRGRGSRTPALGRKARARAVVCAEERRAR
jgi:hypothetical protein